MRNTIDTIAEGGILDKVKEATGNPIDLTNLILDNFDGYILERKGMMDEKLIADGEPKTPWLDGYNSAVQILINSFDKGFFEAKQFGQRAEKIKRDIKADLKILEDLGIRMREDFEKDPTTTPTGPDALITETIQTLKQKRREFLGALIDDVNLKRPVAHIGQDDDKKNENR